MSQRRKIERELGFNRATPDLLAQAATLSPADRERLGLEMPSPPVLEEPAPVKKVARKKAES